MLNAEMCRAKYKYEKESITTKYCPPYICINNYRIYSCISRPFTTKKSAQKIALDLYTSHTQRPDKAVQEINITIA